jgi:hypothetical protein
MNSYTVHSLISEGHKTQAPTLLYVIIPLVFGVCIDILFTQIMGSQFCSYDDNEYKCNIHGIRTKQWQRETVRCILQFGLIMCALLLIQNTSPLLIIPIYTSLVGVTGIILLFLVQTDLFIDFRRLCNGLVFALKHN